MAATSLTSVFLNAAAVIGARLVDRAIWDRDRCSWIVMVPDPTTSRPARAAVPQPAGPALYQGTAGIGLFLGELTRLTGDPAVRNAAIGALRHAVTAANDDRVGVIGFHSGRVGIAWSAARVGMIADCEELVIAAGLLLQRAAGAERGDRNYDIIGGAAGAITALLQLSSWLESQGLVDIAVDYGRHLVREAWYEPVGWSWSGSDSAAVRNLAGYAHGAAGIGHALTELFYHTGWAEFRYAARQAFLYESQFFDPAVLNWLDLRNVTLSRYGYEGRMSDLVEELRRGVNPAPYRATFMKAWCHGAPGIGNSRLRAVQVLGDDHLREELGAAVRTTVGSLERDWANYSLCHGVAGNCETLLLAANVFPNLTLRKAAERHMAKGIERFGGWDWPCGTQQAVNDPSLMLGEAGIGHFMLRLHDAETPSVLLPMSPRKEAAPVVGCESETEYRRQHVAKYFGRSITAVVAFGDRPLASCDGEGEPGIRGTERRIRAVISTMTDPVYRGLLQDVLQLDEAALAVVEANTDFTAHRIRMLSRLPAGVPSDVPLILRPDARIVVVEHDWDSWIALPPTHRERPQRERIASLLYPVAGRVIRQRLSGLAECVLCEFMEPTTVAEAIERMRAPFGSAREAIRDALPRLNAQIQHAYHAGIIESIRRPAPPVGHEPPLDRKGVAVARVESRSLHHPSPGVVP